MTVLLGFLFVVSFAGLVFVGYHAFHLHTSVTRLETDLTSQRTRYEQDVKQRNDYCANAKTQYQDLVNKYNQDIKKLKEYAIALKTENERLSKWKNIADAEVKATEMVRTAQATLEKAQADADNLISTAQQRSTNLLTDTDQKARSQLASANETASMVASEAREKANAHKTEAQAILDSVTSQAAKILDAANKKAEEIGGSAYEAMRNASLYE